LPAISSVGADDGYETATKQKHIPKNKAYELIESEFVTVRGLQEPAAKVAEGGL
jgi:hypothetical protein